jgi:ATP-dependent RNA helicase DeaD
VTVEPGQVRVWVSAGAADEAALKTLLGGLGAPVDKIAKVDLRGSYAYLHIAEADVPAFEAVTGETNGKTIRLEKERERKEEKPERRERKPPREEVDVAPGNLRLWLNLGKADGVDEASLGTALTALGVPTEKVTKTELRGTYSYLHVAEGDAAAFESALAGKQHGEKALKVERARR